MRQGGIITRILASRMQQSFEPRAKFSSEVIQKYAISAKPMRHTGYFGQSICSKSLGCGKVKNFMSPCLSLSYHRLSYTLQTLSATMLGAPKYYARVYQVIIYPNQQNCKTLYKMRNHEIQCFFPASPF